ncbi:MAG TPA: hypothetical protein VFG63_06420 [Nocardioidaceae bacterium]|nr:hypothetical protein [Nocardioidaceae bacterium]
MTENHPDGDRLLELALDDVQPGARDSTLKHLSTCRQCRNEYDDISSTVEQTLAAAPSVEPEPGFDARVLGAMGFEPAPVTELGRRRWRSRRWQLVAASVAAGLVVGVGGSYGFSQLNGSEPSVVAQNSSFLETSDGERVGTVTSSTVDGRPSFVVTVHSGRVGMSYLCVLRLANGEQIETATWMLDSDRGETWVVDSPDQKVSELVLVANGGAGPVWSTARL